MNCYFDAAMVRVELMFVFRDCANGLSGYDCNSVYVCVIYACNLFCATFVDSIFASHLSLSIFFLVLILLCQNYIGWAFLMVILGSKVSYTGFSTKRMVLF